jgi:tetratricopeptide (TPR) repeat protein
VAVRTEARIRLGYLHWATGDNERARAALAAAAQSAPTADLRYLAHYLTGATLESGADTDGAITAYAAALEARPHSQSASIRLAVLRQLRGDAAGAQSLAQESLDARPADADPWRLFLYGHYPQFPLLLAEVRGQVPR